MLSLILGRSGYGKTNLIYKRIKELTEKGEKVLLFVPEQFSFESEKRLYFELGATNGINAEVTNFSRLCHSVFHRYGKKGGIYLSKGGKKAVLKLVLEELKDELEIYGRSSSSAGFLESAGYLMDQIKRSGLGSEEIRGISGKLSSGELMDKFSEALLIYEGYGAYLERGFADSEDDMRLCLEILREHKFFEGYHVFIDEFKGFTSVEKDVIENIIIGAKSTTCAFCVPNLVDDEEGLGVFSGVQKTANRLISLAKKNGVKAAPPVYLETNHRAKNASISQIESGLFSRAKPSKIQYDERALQVFEAKTRHEEIQYIASKIRALTREKSLRYNEILIVGREIDSYKNALDTVLPRYEIPYFYGVREAFYHKPLPSFLRAVLKASVQSFDNESIFSALKTGLLETELEDICILENYVYMWSIKGEMWASEFVQNPRGFTNKMTDEDINALGKINQVRADIIEIITKIRKKDKELSGEDFALLIYETMLELNLDDKQKSMIEAEGNPMLQTEYRRTWDLMIEILDELSVIFKHHLLSKQKFIEILDLMIESADLGTIPQKIDEVLVGDASLVRAPNIKAVFVVGCNEEFFPKIPEETSFFSDEENKQLIHAGLEISDTLDSKLIDEEFIAYKTLAISSDMIFLTYPLNDDLAKRLYPSSLIASFDEVFESFSVIYNYELSPEFYVQNKRSLLYEYAKLLHTKKPEKDTMLGILKEDKNVSKLLNRMDLIKSRRPIMLASEKIRNEFFGENIPLSPTSVERYYSCPFSYFASHGLKISKPIKAEISPLLVGNVVHHVLQIIMQKHGGKGLALLSKEEIDEEIRLALEAYLISYLGGIQDKTSRFKYLYTRLKNTLAELINRLGKEFAQSEFEPIGYETHVSKKGEIPPIEVELADGTKAYVEGIIDRVDVMKKGRTNYIRVIDYKTGSRDFKLSNVYYGLDLQMLIYLFSATNSNYISGENKPAGIFYMPAKVTDVETDEGMGLDEIHASKLKTFRMNGLVVNDREVVAGMEKKGEGIFIPVKFKGENDLTAGSASHRLATYEELGKIYEHIERLVSGMGNQLKNGDIKAFPNRDGDLTACDYCQYRGICSRETDESYNELKNLNKSKFYEMLKEASEDEVD